MSKKNPCEGISDCVIVRAVEDCKIALPHRDFELRKEDVITLPKAAVFPLWKRGKIEIIHIEEGDKNELGELRKESMANVES